MYERYNKKNSLINNSNEYEQVFQRKKINLINQFPTFDFNKLKDLEENNINFIIHKVKITDKLYQISEKYYGSPEFGWAICYTNKLANELLITEGMILKIYYPITELLRLLNV